MPRHEHDHSHKYQSSDITIIGREERTVLYAHDGNERRAIRELEKMLTDSGWTAPVRQY